MTEIARNWRAPRAAMRRQLGRGLREDRALALLMLACFIIFVAPWPRLSREAHLDPSVPLEARLGEALFGMMFIMTLASYALAGLTPPCGADLLAGGAAPLARGMALYRALLASWAAVAFQRACERIFGPELRQRG
jgi:hypothetical protein